MNNKPVKIYVDGVLVDDIEIGEFKDNEFHYIVEVCEMDEIYRHKMESLIYRWFIAICCSIIGIVLWLIWYG